MAEYQIPDKWPVSMDGAIPRREHTVLQKCMTSSFPQDDISTLASKNYGLLYCSAVKFFASLPFAHTFKQLNKHRPMFHEFTANTGEVEMLVNVII
jgi:hypothetical protein